MATIHANVHLTGTTIPFAIQAGDDSRTYFVLKHGYELTIFLDPDQVIQLADALAPVARAIVAERNPDICSLCGGRIILTDRVIADLYADMEVEIIRKDLCEECYAGVLAFNGLS